MVDKTRGTFPTGQTHRGTPAAGMGNPKTTNKRNSIGSKGDGTDLMRQNPRDDGDADAFTARGELGERGNRKNKGTPADIPDPGGINTTYTPNGPARRSTTSVSDERVYPIDPGKQKLGSTGGVPYGEDRQTPRGGGD